ncbi:MFS transporter [Streptomyces sp. SID8352]|uniref:MFS transporter n=1 Tax=Streptomyces sp. SID8352 TaxID=2690338 RepID=UPI0031F64A1D
MTTSAARPTYAAVFRFPRARRTFLSALVGRLSYGTVSLALMLSVTRSTGSYAVAGTVMALFGAAGVVLTPTRAALVDRYGPRRALPPMALLYAALLCVLAAVARLPGVHVAPLAATAVLAGACAPPLGPTMRAVWAALLPDRELLQRAYSLDGVAEELLFVTGPLLIGVVIGVASPDAGVVLSALLVAVGTLAFAASPATGALNRAAPPAPDGAPEHPGDPGTVGDPGTPAALGAPGAPADPRVAGRPVRVLVQPVAVAAGVGLALSAVDLLAVASAGERGLGDGAVAWMLAALSAGSAVGGLLNGAVRWSTAARVRLPLLVAGLGLTLAVAGLAPGPGTLVAVLAVAGLFVSPALTTAYLIADASVPPGFRVRAGAWVNTAVNAGSSAGMAAVGLLLERVPPAGCFALCGACALAAALVPGGRERAGGGGRRSVLRPRRGDDDRPRARAGGPDGGSGGVNGPGGGPGRAGGPSGGAGGPGPSGGPGGPGVGPGGTAVGS